MTSSAGTLFAFLLLLNPISAHAANQAPVAYATSAAVSGGAKLDASRSSDPDGSIVSYYWSQKSGPGVSTFSDRGAMRPLVSVSVTGTYQYTLVVKDNSGASSSDWTGIFVKKGSLAGVPPSGSSSGSGESCLIVKEWNPYPTLGVANLSCPSGQVIKSVSFASYGNPTSCSAVGSCNSASSKSKVEQLCLNKASCSLTHFNNLFGDPCSGVSKKLAVQVSCGTSGNPVPSPSPKPSASPVASPKPSASPVASPKPSASPVASPKPSASPVAVSTARACATAREWTPYPVKGVLNLSCPAGMKVKSVDFASYGTPTGSCGAFAVSACNAANSKSVVSQRCIGLASCSIKDFDVNFQDACSGVMKNLAVQVTCASAGAPTPYPSATPAPSPKPSATATPVPPSGGAAGAGATTTINIPQIGEVDSIEPGRGAELWQASDQAMPYPSTSGFSPADVYYRFTWSGLEPSKGAYNWSNFDSKMNDAITKGQKLGFGIMTYYPDCEGDCPGGMAYPTYIKNEGGGWGSGNNYVPNWNSEAYLSGYERLLKAMNAHIMSSSYNGVQYKNAINYVDVRGYGPWGEFHSVGIVNNMNDYPAGMRPTAATLIRIIDAHVKGFPDFQLVALFAAFDANYLQHTMNPPEVGYHALTVRNNVGLLGWRRDNWGITDSYFRAYTDQNNRGINGLNFANEIMNRFRYAPVNGEPMNGPDPGLANSNGSAVGSGGGCAYFDLAAQIKFYHAASIGNGNFWGYSTSSCQRANISAAFRASGYRIVINGGSFISSVASDRKLTVKLNWRNLGVAPTYEKWNTMFELRNASGGVVWSGQSAHVMRLFLPAASDTVVQDTFALPTSIAAGNYTLHVVVRDPNGYRKPLPLNIQGRGSDGAYYLGAVKVP